MRRDPCRTWSCEGIILVSRLEAREALHTIGKHARRSPASHLWVVGTFEARFNEGIILHGHVRDQQRPLGPIMRQRCNLRTCKEGTVPRVVDDRRVTTFPPDAATWQRPVK